MVLFFIIFYRTNGVSVCYGAPPSFGSKLPTFDWVEDATCFKQFIKKDCDIIESRQNPVSG